MDFYGTPNPASTKLPTELRSSREYDPIRGLFIVKHWRGTPAEIQKLIDEVIGLQGVRYIQDPEDSGYERVSAYYSSDSLAEGAPADPSIIAARNEWELDGNDEGITLWELPAVRAAVANVEGISGGVELMKNTRQRIAKFVANDPDVVFDDIRDVLETGTGITEESIVALENLARRLANGIEVKQVSSYVIRQQFFKPIDLDVGTFEVSTANVGRVLTSEYMVRNVVPEAKLLFKVPGAHYWLKRTPNVRTARGQHQITQEYYGSESYDSFLWGEAIDV